MKILYFQESSFRKREFKRRGWTEIGDFSDHDEVLSFVPWFHFEQNEDKNIAKSIENNCDIININTRKIDVYIKISNVIMTDFCKYHDEYFC